jgi:hypothetical protein
MRGPSSRLSRPAVAALAAATVIALGSLVPVLGAEPPPGVVLDGVVTVTAARAPAAGGGGLGGAEVRLVARLNDFPEGILQELSATADAAGIATFTGVARPAEGGPAVHLTAQASTTTTATDANGCTVSESWFGQSGDVLAAPTVALVVEAFPASSIACPPPSPSPSGSVLGAVGTPRPATTPPPTDTAPPPASPSTASVGLVVGGLLMLVLAAASARGRRVRRGRASVPPQPGT